MIVYLALAIQAFVMYCVNGTSHSSLLIESTDSMIKSMINVGGMVRYDLHKDIRKKFTYTSFSQFCLYVCNTYDSHEGRTAFLC